MSREKGPDEIYCRSCGKPIKKRAEICPNCGVANEYTNDKQKAEQPRQNTNSATQQQNNSRTQGSSGSALSSSGPTEHDPSNYTTQVTDSWRYGVGAGVLLMIVGFAMPEGSGAAGFFFLTSMVLMPVSIYYDHKWVQATTKWKPEAIVWIILSIIPFVNIFTGSIYLFRRYNTSEISSPNKNNNNYPGDDPALAQLRERYSQGEISEEEFEQKVEKIIGTEDTQTAQEHIRMRERSKEEKTN